MTTNDPMTPEGQMTNDGRRPNDARSANNQFIVKIYGTFSIIVVYML